MRTASPRMDVTRPERPEVSNLAPDVTGDVTGDVSQPGRPVVRDAVAGAPCRRQKRQAESPDAAPTRRKSPRTARAQALAQQRHLMEAVRSGDAGELRRLLERNDGKPDVNFFDNDGQTALHHSCVDGNFELVKLLVKFGADTKLANRDGWNPLHIASFSGHRDIVLYLIGGR